MACFLRSIPRELLGPPSFAFPFVLALGLPDALPSDSGRRGRIRLGALQRIASL